MANETVDVRDRKNPERLLGRLMRRPCALHGNAVEMAVMPRLSLGGFDPWDIVPGPAEMPYTRVRFEVSYRTSDGGYAKHAEFLTDTPLGVLAMVESFRFPGETEEQARHRQLLSRH